MGLDTSHDCWHGPYSSFMHFRMAIANHVGLPLRLMQGFIDDKDLGDVKIPGQQGIAAIPWSVLKPDPLWGLLNHSDCDGIILHGDCHPIAERLHDIAAEMESNPPDEQHGSMVGYSSKYLIQQVRQFEIGLRLAASVGENVDFH